jgi:hypothetical protein
MYSNDDVQREWINWSHGAAFGKTITLTSSNGYFLVSFLTLYVAFAGNRFWVIVAFIFQLGMATKEHGDDEHNTRQAVLYYSSTPMSALCSFSAIAFHGKKTGRPFLRTLLLIAVALFTAGAFIAASVLASQVVSGSSNEVLIASSNCSYWEPAKTDSFHQGGFRTKLTVDALAAATYSRACYGSSSTTSTQCDTYITRQIPWNETTGPKCPFSSPELCLLSPPSVYQMDTGLIDSHSHLGLNARKAHRIAYRRLTTCAPINATKFLKISKDGSNDIYNYSFGSNQQPTGGNLTFSYNSRAIYDKIGYQIVYVLVA